MFQGEYDKREQAIKKNYINISKKNPSISEVARLRIKWQEKV
jgi:hypothetical protein